jgi:hypothetical protein
MQMMSTYWLNKSKRPFSHSYNTSSSSYIDIIHKPQHAAYAKDSLDWEFWVHQTVSNDEEGEPNEEEGEVNEQRESGEEQQQLEQQSEESKLFNNLIETITASSRRSSQKKQRVEEPTYDGLEHLDIPENEDLRVTYDKEDEKELNELSVEEYLDHLIEYVAPVKDNIDNIVKRELADMQEMEQIDSVLKDKIEQEVNELFTQLTAEEFDKLFYDARAENMLLKDLKKKIVEKAKSATEEETRTAYLLHRLEPDSLSLTSNQEYRKLLNTMLDGTLTLDNLRDVVREARSEYARKSERQRTKELLSTSYKFYLQQRDLDFEKQRNEYGFSQLVKKYDELFKFSLETYKTNLGDLYSKSLPTGVVDSVFDKIVSGASVAEAKKYFDSVTHVALETPEYEYDEYASFREEIQQQIDERQYDIATNNGIKTGRRNAMVQLVIPNHDETEFAQLIKNNNGQRTMEALQLPSPDRFFEVVDNCSRMEKWDRKVDDGYKLARTYMPKRAREKRMERTAMRRFNIIKLENTIRAFSWVRKYRPRFFA